MIEKKAQNELGQNMIVFAILMVIFVALAALVIDGGFAYTKRREAQNAADAGALAGANVLCALNPVTSPEDTAWDYAVTRNGAQDADIIVNDASNTITVTTTIPHQSFLAGIIGQDLINTTATASAGCYSPCVGEGILPVAWACNPPLLGGSDCDIDYGTIDEPGPIYIVMDSNKAVADYQCQDPPNSGSPSAALDCDFDNDGENDLIAGGGRSWLDLDGDDGGHSIDPDWISGGFDQDIPVHLWLPGSDGNSANIFGAAGTRTGDYVILPVFDHFTVGCNPDPAEGESCSSLWHADIPDQIRSYSTTAADYYHIITFSVFKITCVSKVPGQHCPTKDYLVTNHIIDHQVKTIEGYFVEGYVPGLSGRCDYDAGAYTIYLNH